MARAGDVFNSLWVGDRLLPLANACINSFIHQGCAFNLYTYGAAEDRPALAEHLEAEEIIPHERCYQAHGGWETFTEEFAYEGLRRFGGWWIDNDVVCNTDQIPDAEIFFAEEKVGVINNAVLKFPKGHAAIEALLDYIKDIDPVTAQWGARGPLALSKVFSNSALQPYKREISDIYPLHWKEAPKLLFPEFTGEVVEKIANSPFVHLWGATLREVNFDMSKSLPLEGSYLNILYKDHLDKHILDRLMPIEESDFRNRVRDYVAKNWGLTLPIRT
jgi:hypothetical protein